MKILKASDHGICPEQEITAQLYNLIDAAKKEPGKKTICFEKGTYYIDSEKCRKYMLHITNTVGDSEFSPDETPHINGVPFYFGDMKDLTFDGGGASFVIDGKVTNAAVVCCQNITLKNFEIRHTHPDMHMLEVLRVTPFYVDFEIDRDTQYGIQNNKLYFYGRNYTVAADKNAPNAFWIGLIRAKTPEKIQRVSHPLFGALKITQRAGRCIRVHFTNTLRFRKGDCYHIFDVRRQFAGIFIDRSENVVLENIRQRFNYSLALVAQDSENIAMRGCEFAPEKGSARKMASVADFIQVCMCRGRFTAENNLFDGAGDDCMNVHGVHYKIVKNDGSQLTLRYMHPQTHGFNPLRTGDTVAFIDPKSMLETGKATITSSKLLNEYELQITIDTPGRAPAGAVIEDISACPDVVFRNNTLTRIITRGLLLTTRGDVLIENNRFISTTMSGILLSDDAKSWYESGMCRNVRILNNTFDYCGQTPVLIKPENTVHKGPVHKNIEVSHNVFQKYSGYCVQAKSTDNILLKGNRYNSSKIIKQSDCTNVRVIKKNDS